MWVSISFSQLEEGLRNEAQQILVRGWFASELYDAIAGKCSTLAWSVEPRRMLLDKLSQYDIVNFRGKENNPCLLLSRRLTEITVSDRSDRESTQSH